MTASNRLTDEIWRKSESATKERQRAKAINKRIRQASKEGD